MLDTRARLGAARSGLPGTAWLSTMLAMLVMALQQARRGGLTAQADIRGDMGNEYKGLDGHSAEYFGDARDHWHNRDFLELMARRWKLSSVTDVLDVGCGVGHWSMALAPVLPSGARVTGIDREPRWVQAATARAQARGLGQRYSYQVAAAERLPFADGSFDLVTCQTLLIHMPAPSAVLAEMQRVARPGGLVAVAEPHNLAGSLLMGSLVPQISIDDLVEITRFELTCQRGKVALGEGDNSLGDRVAGLFAELGFEAIDAYVVDRAVAVLPPYATPAQRAFVEDVHDRLARGFWNWSEAETRHFFLAGGGTERAFLEHWARSGAVLEQMARALDAGTYHGTLGGVFFLVAGRKPAGAMSAG